MLLCNFYNQDCELGKTCNQCGKQICFPHIPDDQKCKKEKDRDFVGHYNLDEKMICPACYKD